MYALLMAAAILATRETPQDPQDKIKELEEEKPEAKEAKDGEPGFKVDAPLVQSLRIGGQVRIRGEWRDPRSYAKDEADDFAFLRTRLHIHTDIVDHLRAMIQIQDSRKFGEEGSSLTADGAGVDLKQGWFEVHDLFDVPLSLRAGRMEVPALGDQRLVSPLDWSNTGRSWDGLHLAYEPEGWKLFGVLVNTKEADSTGDADDDYWFTGLYATCRKLAGHEFDLYFFHRNLSDRDFDSEDDLDTTADGDRKDFTVGFRAKGTFGGFTYTGEIVGQFGKHADDDLQAWAAALTAAYTFDFDWKPSIGLEYAYAGGDDDPSDGDRGTFDPLYPFSHSFHGHIDLISWRNLHAVKLTLAVRPVENLSLHADLHGFWRAEKMDAWYGLGGPIRTDPTGDAGRYIGTELDLYAKYKLWNRLHLWGGYSHFFAGEFVEDTGDSPDMDWVFLMVTVDI